MIKEGREQWFTFWLWKIAWAAVKASAVKIKHTSAFSDYIINKTEVFENTYNIEICEYMNRHELKGKV